MLFNSFEFIFVFLPLTLAGFFWLGAQHRRLAAAWLTASSLFFYGWWNPSYVLLLGASILGNFWLGSAIARAHTAGDMKRGRGFLIIAITANLLLLGYYKYANFFLATVADLSGAQLTFGQIILPLGISFFTFTQIAFLVDAHVGKAKEYNLVHYALFVTYFPHLIAGPVLHHKEMMPQFARADNYRVHAENIAVGGTIFLIGLFKKTVLADGISPYVAPVFDAALRGERITFFEAWGGALAYTLQLYFDFSGYSDMAIGLSRLFGIHLPLNFNSPYKAKNIIDFWRRWHMTLSRFLRDYLYVPLGGNRRGTVRRYVNLAITMVLGGLWHGAAWTFVVWGALHGIYLMINHAWIALQAKTGHRLRMYPGCARALTLGAVIVGWVFFRAASFDAAFAMLQAMTGSNGIAIPAGLMAAFGSIGEWMQQLGIESSIGGGMTFVTMYMWILALLAIALYAPNTQQIMSRFFRVVDATSVVRSLDTMPTKLQWMPRWQWAAFIGVLGAAALLSLNRVSEFLYFQF